MSLTVFIRYQIDPDRPEMFEDYARRWLGIIPRCGGSWSATGSARAR